uniref:Transducin/WD40 repeat-like superfamily protein n=1 Tax=Heterorhabditis bacteriophora TaxID=37862 RepID=A0A1I7XV90_HETBA
MVRDNYRSITVHSSHFPLGKALNYCESLKYLDTRLLRHVTNDEKSAEKHALGKRAPAVLFSPGGHQLLISLNGACDSCVLKFTVSMVDIPSEYHFLMPFTYHPQYIVILLHRPFSCLDDVY